MKSKSERIINIASKIANLPTLPTVAAKMIELADNPKTKSETLAELISNDPALTARILKAANSDYYGLSREISTVDTAIVVLGHNTVKGIGLSLSVFDTLKNIGAMKRFNIQKYWEHSVGVGIVARETAKTYLHDYSAQMYVAGLLHDIGKLILIQYAPDDFNTILDFTQENGVPFFEAEQEILGINHSEIGYIIADRWNIPDKIKYAIRFHHSPASAKNLSAAAAIINTADTICNNYDISSEITAMFAPENTFDNNKVSRLKQVFADSIEKNELLHSNERNYFVR